MIATTGITIPVAALSFVVKAGEVFSGAELLVGLKDVIFEAEDTNVVEGNGSAESVDDKDVALTICTSAVAITTGLSFPLQVEKPI